MDIHPSPIRLSVGRDHFFKSGRGDRIRTYDPLVPNQMRYQAAPYSVSREEIGVDEGARTLDNRNHNPGLYQLSYNHHYNISDSIVSSDRWRA